MRFGVRGVPAAMLFVLAAGAQDGPAPPRKALLIVNSTYKNLPVLESPRRDRVILEESLKSTGFAVTVFENYGLQELATRFAQYTEAIQPTDHVLVYYSGFALQAGDNFLLPVDFDTNSREALATRALSLTRLQDDLTAALRIILVDGARERPPLIPGASGIGLSTPDVSSETAILFANDLDEVSPEPPAGSAGILATSFSRLIRQPDSSIASTFSFLQTELTNSSGHKPYFVTRLTRTFYFTAPIPKPPVDSAPRDVFTKIPQRHRTDRQNYVFVPGGTFKMGCIPSTRKQDECEDVEKPQHEVRLASAFWIGETEVTIDAYDRFLGFDRSKKEPDKPFWKKELTRDHPIVNVSWADAADYCKWVGGRLPTEAEWEFAARGGKAEIYPFDSENGRERANFIGTKGNDRYNYTAPVKSFDPNGWGLFDMSGNVWEWTADWFNPSYYAQSPSNDPPGPPTGSDRVVRGGSFYSDPAKHLRISFRARRESSDRVGFRCLLPDSIQIRTRFANSGSN